LAFFFFNIFFCFSVGEAETFHRDDSAATAAFFVASLFASRARIVDANASFSSLVLVDEVEGIHLG